MHAAPSKGAWHVELGSAASGGSSELSFSFQDADELGNKTKDAV